MVISAANICDVFLQVICNQPDAENGRTHILAKVCTLILC